MRWGINETQIGADIALRGTHTVTHINPHTLLLSGAQTVVAVDELSVSLSVSVTSGINNPTGQKTGRGCRG